MQVICQALDASLPDKRVKSSTASTSTSRRQQSVCRAQLSLRERLKAAAQPYLQQHTATFACFLACFAQCALSVDAWDKAMCAACSTSSNVQQQQQPKQAMTHVFDAAVGDSTATQQPCDSQRAQEAQPIVCCSRAETQHPPSKHDAADVKAYQGTSRAERRDCGRFEQTDHDRQHVQHSPNAECQAPLLAATQDRASMGSTSQEAGSGAETESGNSVHSS